MKITFASKACGRCGGTGAYHMACRAEGVGGFSTGACWDCRGTGRRMLPTGSKARAAYFAKREELAGVPVEQIQVGDKVLIDGKWHIVTEAKGATLCYAHCSYGFLPGTKVIVAAKLAATAAELHAFASTLKGATLS